MRKLLSNTDRYVIIIVFVNPNMTVGGYLNPSKMQLRNDICFGCVQCKFYLCQSCYGVVYQGNPNYGLHTGYQLTTKVFVGWRCNGCAKRVQVSKKLSMRCRICDKDYCL